MTSDTFDWETVAKMAGELLGNTGGVSHYYSMTPLEWYQWFEGELKDQQMENDNETPA